MKAMILAAGLGTRLKPWTLSHPKALVPVQGTPMLERVILRLKEQGFNYIVVNVHHFASQIVEFLASKDFGVQVCISDESGKLLDTGGGILHAADLLMIDDRPFLVHNVDILSTANLKGLMSCHNSSTDLATLLVSERESSRRLVFDSNNSLKGWLNLSTSKSIPEHLQIIGGDKMLAFSGIYVLSTDAFGLMRDQYSDEPFPIMDFFLNNMAGGEIRGYEAKDLKLIDIGKPETLSRANNELIFNNQ